MKRDSLGNEGMTAGQHPSTPHHPTQAAAPAPPTEPPPAAPAPAPQPVLDTYMNRELKHIEREASGEVKAHYIVNDGAPLSGRLLIGLKNVFSKCLPNMPKEYITRLVFDRRHRWAGAGHVWGWNTSPPALRGTEEGRGVASLGAVRSRQAPVPQGVEHRMAWHGMVWRAPLSLQNHAATRMHVRTCRSVIITRNQTTIIAGITYRPFHAQRFAEIAFCAVAQSLQVSGFGTRLMAWTKVGTCPADTAAPGPAAAARRFGAGLGRRCSGGRPATEGPACPCR